MKRSILGAAARRAGLALAVGAALFAISSCRQTDGADGGKAAVGAAAEFAFRSSVESPPPGESVPFKLSANYPTAAPAACAPADCPWLTMNVNFDTSFPPKPVSWQGGGWDRYIASILTYVRKGQDPNLADQVGFRPDIGGGGPRWFNVPWVAYDPSAGREYRHGTTNERTAHLQDLIGPDGKPLVADDSVGAVHLFAGMSDACKGRYPEGFETWSVGYYNPQGGYAIGRSIPKDGVPKTADYMGTQMLAGLPFPAGTAVVKVLTTNAPPECVPALKGSPEWRVNRHVLGSKHGKPSYMCARAVQVSRVVQIDVAVTDPRSPTGWVYGTYAYDGNQPGATFWDRLVPLGVQWGTDPWTFPAVPDGAASLPLQQSVANPAIGTGNLYEHMGCRGRLAGPVDNPQSSCVSCHASAYAAKPGAKSVMGQNVPPSFGFDGLCTAYSADNASYFQTARPPQSFAGGK